MALGSNWMNTFNDATYDQGPGIDVETARILRNDEELEPYEVSRLINEALRERADALGLIHATVPADQLQDYDAGRDAMMRAVDDLRNSFVKLEPETGDSLATLDHDRRMSLGLGVNVETAFPGTEPLENRDLVTVAVRSTPAKSPTHEKVSALLQGQTAFNTREVVVEVNRALAHEAEELMTQDMGDAQQLSDLNEREIQDKPENLGTQRYDQGRRELAAAVSEVRRSNKVAFINEVTDHLVTLDHDGLMSQQLGVEVAELYGRNPGHVPAQRSTPDFSKAVDPSLTPTPVLRQPVSELSRDVREAQRDALAAAQPVQTLHPAAETLQQVREGLKKPKTVVPAPIPKFEKKVQIQDDGPEL